MLPYTLKRFIAQFLMPVPLVIEIFLLGWVIIRFTRFKRVGVAFQVLAGVLFFLFGAGFGGRYLYSIEREYPPFNPSVSQREGLRGTDVVVLGQTFADNSDLPIRYRANSSMYMRIMEGVRAAKLIQDSRLLVSVAGDAAVEDKESFVEEFAQVFGIPRSRIIILLGAKDTSDEARLALAQARSKNVVVATSASHIPRAMRIFKKQGATPLAAPCDYKMFSDKRSWSWRKLPLPSGGGFEQAGAATYEWLGMIYEKLSD